MKGDIAMKKYQIFAALVALTGALAAFFCGFLIIEKQQEEIEALRQQRDAMSRLVLEQALRSFDAQTMEFSWRTYGGLPAVEKVSDELTPMQLERAQGYIDSFRFERLVSKEEFNSVNTGVWAELEFDCPWGHVYTDASRVSLTTPDGQSHCAYFELDHARYQSLLNSLSADAPG